MTIVIPTLNRERVLLDTISHVLSQLPTEIIVVDQTAQHEPETRRQLLAWEKESKIRILTLESPSIPKAMNMALVESLEEIILFLDDDVVPCPRLLSAHASAHASNRNAWAVVGQVLQPGEAPASYATGKTFRFNSNKPCWIQNAIGCNLSVKRNNFIAVGGFDENFIGAAYMFEAEFAARILDAGGAIYFEPAASIRHLRAKRGGTRAHGNHLTTASPLHSAGAHYFYFVRSSPVVATLKSLMRIVRSVRTRHHLLRPWYIPITLLAEFRGLSKAVALKCRGPRLLSAKL